MDPIPTTEYYIPSLVRNCLKLFKTRRGEAITQRNTDFINMIVDEQARFKIWVGNLSADVDLGSHSLEYTLRSSKNLRAKVIDLLQDLEGVLTRCESASRRWKL